MSETAEHLSFVQVLVKYIQDCHAPCDGITILTDTAGAPTDGKPHRIGGFVPDVYAVNIPTTFCIIGEAKVESDLETEHSRLQLEAFLQHLSLSGSGTLILAVPWQVSVAARRILLNAAAKINATNVEKLVLDSMGNGARC